MTYEELLELEAEHTTTQREAHNGEWNDIEKEWPDNIYESGLDSSGGYQ